MNSKRGIISVIVIFVILVLIVSAFRVNLRGYISAGPEQALESNVVLIRETGKVIWLDYIKYPINTFWNNYVAPFMKGEFLSGLKTKLKQRGELPEDN
ncbi:MAG: hypothetical protein AAB590_00410 [Patescibacteria group bacterium]